MMDFLFQMEFVRFDPSKHNLVKVVQLIFETEPAVFSIYFGKNKKKCLSRIKKIVKVGKNSFGYDFIFLAMENNQILGLCIFYRGNDIDLDVESKKFYEAIGKFGVTRLYLYEKILFSRILTKDINTSDMYISNVCVDKANRGKAIGKFLLKNIIDQAKVKNCKRIILDVSQENQIAISLYKKMGFKISRKRSSFLWGIKIFQMVNDL